MNLTTTSSNYLDILVEGAHLFYGSHGDTYRFYLHAQFPAADALVNFADTEIQSRIANLREKREDMVAILSELQQDCKNLSHSDVEKTVRLMPELFVSVNKLISYRNSLTDLRTQPGIYDTQIDRVYKVFSSESINEWVLEVPLGVDLMTHPLIFKAIVEAILRQAAEKYSATENRSDLITKVNQVVQRLGIALATIDRYDFSSRSGREAFMQVYSDACLYVHGFNPDGSVHDRGLRSRIKHYLGKMLPGNVHNEISIEFIEEKSIAVFHDNCRRLHLAEQNIDVVINRLAKSQVRDWVTVDRFWMHQDVNTLRGRNMELPASAEISSRELVDLVRSLGIPVSRDSRSCIHDAYELFERDPEMVRQWKKTKPGCFQVWLALVHHEESADFYELKKRRTQDEWAAVFDVSRRSIINYVKMGRKILRKQYEPVR